MAKSVKNRKHLLHSGHLTTYCGIDATLSDVRCDSDILFVTCKRCTRICAMGLKRKLDRIEREKKQESPQSNNDICGQVVYEDEDGDQTLCVLPQKHDGMFHVDWCGIFVEDEFEVLERREGFTKTLAPGVHVDDEEATVSYKDRNYYRSCAEDVVDGKICVLPKHHNGALHVDWDGRTRIVEDRLRKQCPAEVHVYRGNSSGNAKLG